MGSCPYTALRMADEVDLEDLLAALSAEELSNLVDEMAADPDDKHMPASARTAYRCEKDPTGDLNRDSLINHLNTPDKEEKGKFEPGVKRGKVYVPVYNEAQLAQQEKEDEGQVRLDPEMEEALSNATMKDIMELADILNTNPQDFVMEAYADPLQYFEPDAPNDVKPEEVLEKLRANDSALKEVNLNNICGISEQLFCDIFNALKNNDKCVKFSACNTDLSDLAVSTLCAVLEENSQVKSLSIENNRVSPDAVADLFESIASSNNGLLELRCAAQAHEAMGLRVEERIANAICKTPRIMKAGITLEFKEVITRVSKHMIANMDKLRTNRLKDGVQPGSGALWVKAKTID